MSDISLSFGNSYIGSGNRFSQILLLQKIAQKTGVIVILNSDIGGYKKIASYLQIPFGEKTLSSQDFEDISQRGLIFFTIEDLASPITELQQSLDFIQNKDYEIEKIIHALVERGYEFDTYGKPGSYKKIGDSISIRQSVTVEYILSFWGNTLESLEKRTWRNEETLLGSQKIESLSLLGTTPLLQEGGKILLRDFLKEKKSNIVLIECDFHEKYESLIIDFPESLRFDILPKSGCNSQNLYVEDITLSSLEDFSNTLKKEYKDIHIYTQKTEVVERFIEYNSLPNGRIQEAPLSSGLRSFTQGKERVVLCDDLLQPIFIRKRVKRKLTEDIDLLLRIKPGDFIVHIDHGIGIFESIVQKELTGKTREYLEIHYRENEKLFVPITEVGRVSKYVGDENPKLTPLGGKIWEKKIAKIREDIQVIAEEILDTFAKRKLESIEGFHRDSTALSEFQSHFPYVYTHDQEQAIQDIYRDLEKNTPMERLLVGDVGFGKTEVAFNALFHAWTNKKQAILLSPLVVLAYEHYDKALERFAEFDIEIEIVSRLTTAKQFTQIQKKLSEGKIDILIGTHRVLSEKLEFKNLSLIVIDEEHKFGVKDKEKIKSMRHNVHVLSLSATPIPRSLNMALSGIREISMLRQAPEGRKNIETLVSRFDEILIQQAGKREFERGGQVFFIHNRIENIHVFEKMLKKIFPNKKIIVTHGRLDGNELEERILDFKHKKYDILLSTTVIENGIDFSNVNTIFINEAQRFGISQIHQLRGRVGRSEKKGYCYLLYKKEHLDGEAAKRLRTMSEYSYLGAGFELAMKDLEIRGGGDILGIRQSGQVQEIGVTLFLKMLEEKIEEIKENTGNIKKDIGDIKIDLDIDTYIPLSYFESETDKLNFYREIETIRETEELQKIQEDFLALHEKSENELHPLFDMLRCKLLALEYAITSIKKIGLNFQIDFKEGIDLELLKKFLRLDSEVKFSVVDIKRLRSPTKLFGNDKNFLQYLLDMLEGNLGPKKIKLKR